MNGYPYFPLFISLNNKKIVVAGGGNIAARRVRTLSGFSDSITVIAPDICEELKQQDMEGTITVINRPFEKEDIRDAFLVIAATDTPEVNDRIATLCRQSGIWVNHAGDKRQCDFYFPGVVTDKEIVIGVTASGSNHRLASRLIGFLKEKYREFQVKENEEND